MQDQELRDVGPRQNRQNPYRRLEPRQRNRTADRTKGEIMEDSRERTRTQEETHNLNIYS